jgi:RNA polymerase sigma-70 factor, ECF subfamily
MSGWLFPILRNLFRSDYRKRRREVEDADGFYAESLLVGNAASYWRRW